MRGCSNKMEEALISAEGEARTVRHKAKEAKEADDKALNAKKKADDKD